MSENPQEGNGNESRGASGFVTYSYHLISQSPTMLVRQLATAPGSRQRDIFERWAMQAMGPVPSHGSNAKPSWVLCQAMGPVPSGPVYSGTLPRVLFLLFIS